MCSNVHCDMRGSLGFKIHLAGNNVPVLTGDDGKQNARGRFMLSLFPRLI